jgi:hypothetical protein
MKYRLFFAVFLAASFSLVKTMAAQPQSKAKQEQAKPAADTAQKPGKRKAVPLPPLAPKAKKDTVKTYRKH